MIEIQKDGIQNWNKKYAVICGRCQCEFTCHATDGQHQGPIGHKPGDFVRVACPNCKKECIAY